MKNIPILVILFLSSCFSLVSAQETWSLERCIRHALDNSLLIRSAMLSEELAQVNLNQSRQQRFPSLNANAGAGLNFGRVINPATNDFETENSLFSNIGASSGVMLYQGGFINHNIRQAGFEADAAHEDLRQTQSDLALQVALSYLSVLFATENLQNAQATLALTQQQLDQIEKMIAAGTIPASDRYDILAQIALDEQSIVQYQNDEETNLLGLKHLLLLDPGYDLRLDRPVVSIDGMEAFETYKLEAVYSAALASQPQIKAQDLRMRSAELDESIARSGYLPRLSLSGSIGTNYSDLDKTILGVQTTRVPTPGVYINGEQVLFEVDTDFPTGLETTPVFDQFDNNLGYGISVGLSIPIYNNHATRAAVSRAKIGISQQQVASEQVRQTLKSDIQNALAAARAAREALDASERAFEAAEIAYQNAERRFALGAINNYDFISARNRLDAARINQTIAKYDYLFRAKVIEYYLGRGLKLN